MAARRAEVTAAGAVAPRATTGGRILALQAAALLAFACLLPWWRMENRAPQYGLRVLWVEVSPLGVAGDVKEIDGLGHYVGMRSIESLAHVERMFAPYGMALAVACALALAFARGGRLRNLAALAVVAVPLGFVADLWFWQWYAVSHLEPTAALHLISNRIQARLVGDYSVAQFKVHAEFAAGFWLALVAAVDALGFLVAERRRAPRAAAPAPKPRPVGAPVSSFASLLLLLPLSNGTQLEVGPASSHRTVAAALEASAPGDTIVVHPGLYRESLVLRHPVRLIGEEGAILDGGGRGTVVLVRAADCEIDGFLIRASGDSLLEEDAAVKVLEADRCTVAGTRIEDSLFGILVRSGRAATLRANHVVGKALPLPRQGDGIRVQDGAGAILEDNTLEASRDLAIWQSNGCVVRRNVVRRCRYGLHYMYCDDNLFEDNFFEGNETGGAIMYSRRLTLRRNRFEGSRGPSAYGLLIKAADDVLAEGNRFVDNTSGVFLEESPSSRHATCVFRGNVFGGNEVGVLLQPSVERVVFAGNAFVANRVQVETAGRGRGDLNVWSENGRGNYWSDYVGFDADHDGVGDTPYRVEAFFEDLAGRYPAVALLRLGPAAQALESAARAFPVVKARPVATDDHPLVAPPPALLAAAASSDRNGALVAGGALSIALALLALCAARGSATGDAA
jgi:nitrous oxidase accessory protein